jgi:hypothetical protein
MAEIARVLLLGVLILAAAFLFTPYEAILEGILAIILVAAVVLGFTLYPLRDVFHLRTTLTVATPDGNLVLEHDYLAVKVQLVRLWLLFLPTLLAVGFLVVTSANGILWNFSLLNGIFSSEYAYLVFYPSHWLPWIVGVIVWIWVGERRAMRDVQACSAISFTVSGRRVTYSFLDEIGKNYGGDCIYLGLVGSPELASIVFYNPRKPDLNQIAMGLLFHRLIILGRGVTELDKQTAAAQTVLAETAS